MTVYYTATGAPAAATKGLSASIRSEFELIEAAFAALSPAGGTAVSIPYTFSTATTVADPGTGTLRLNQATQNTATAVLADLSDANSIDVTNVLALFDDSTSTVKGFLRIVKLGDATDWLLFSVASMSSPSGYRNITVTNVASSAASPFADGDDILIEFARTGDKGETGDPAPNATQTEMEAATSSTTVLTPQNTKWHPGVAKAWVKCNVAGVIEASHNITSITDDGVGTVTVTIATDFGSANYAITLGTLSANRYPARVAAQAAGSFQLVAFDSNNGSAADPTSFYAACFGDQA